MGYKIEANGRTYSRPERFSKDYKSGKAPLWDTMLLVSDYPQQRRGIMEFFGTGGIGIHPEERSIRVRYNPGLIASNRQHQREDRVRTARITATSNELVLEAPDGSTFLFYPRGGARVKPVRTRMLTIIR